MHKTTDSCDTKQLTPVTPAVSTTFSFPLPHTGPLPHSHQNGRGCRIARKRIYGARRQSGIGRSAAPHCCLHCRRSALPRVALVSGAAVLLGDTSCVYRDSLSLCVSPCIAHGTCVGVFGKSCACPFQFSCPSIHVSSNTRGLRLLVISYTYTHLRARVHTHTHTHTHTHVLVQTSKQGNSRAGCALRERRCSEGRCAPHISHAHVATCGQEPRTQKRGV